MKQKLLAAGLAITLVLANVHGTLAAPGNGQLRSSEKPLRTIKACLLNDMAAPVDSQLIRSAFEQQAEEFLAETGIKLEAAHDVRYLYGQGYLSDVDNLDKDDIDEELRIVFSDRQRLDDCRPIVGNADTYSGVIILYEVTRRNAESGPLCSNVMQTTFKHELGHLFDLPHSKTKESCMYAGSWQSSGRFTRGDLDEIAKNRNQVWHLGTSWRSPWLIAPVPLPPLAVNDPGGFLFLPLRLQSV